MKLKHVVLSALSVSLFVFSISSAAAESRNEQITDIKVYSKPGKLLFKVEAGILETKEVPVQGDSSESMNSMYVYK